MDDLESIFTEGETYSNGSEAFMVMAVASIDETEAWLAILIVDDSGATSGADEICIKAKDYSSWKIREFN